MQGPFGGVYLAGPHIARKALQMLKAIQVEKLKPEAKVRRYGDSGGLYLEVSPSGGKLWRYKYRFLGKEKKLSLGRYPEVGLADARKLHQDARELLAKDIDPGIHKQIQKANRFAQAENSFSAVALEWLEVQSSKWVESTVNKAKARLEKDIFPWLGRRPIVEITAPEVLMALRKIVGRGAVHTAHKAKYDIGQIFRYAVATGRAERDPTGDLRGALPADKTKHFASIVEPKEVGALLRAIDAFRGTYQVQAALKLAPLLFVRPGELRKAKWLQIDLEKAEWRYIATKTNTEHLVPLAAQAVDILRSLALVSGDRDFVFPGRDPKQPMSEAAVNAALRRMGYDTKTEITGHGFRAMARTILHEELHQKPEVIEHQLAHKVSDSLGTAYNRTKFIKERKLMMQIWADYLDQTKADK